MDSFSNKQGFRVKAVVPLAIVDPNTPVYDHLVWRATSPVDAVVAAVARIQSRNNPELKEAMHRIVDAMEGLQQEVIALRVDRDLTRIGIELNPTSVEMGAFSGKIIGLSKPVGDTIAMLVILTIRGASHLLELKGEVTCADSEGVEISFVDINQAHQDLIVAFAFERQREELRRDVDADHS